MDVVFVGGDERFRYAAEELRRRGYDARMSGEWPEGEASAVVVPTAEMLEGKRFRLAVAQRGLSGRESVFCLENDEEYLQANAFLTAEGALQAVMGIGGRAIYGKKCLITGYGRIARALYGMLRAMRADAKVAVRPGKSMRRATEDGAEFIGIEEARRRIGEFEYIWNTVPERIFSAEDVGKMRAGAGIFELASAPFGFDLEKAREMDIWAERLGGLPGKYAPETAGHLLADAVEGVYMERRGAEC